MSDRVHELLEELQSLPEPEGELPRQALSVLKVLARGLAAASDFSFDPADPVRRANYEKLKDLLASTGMKIHLFAGPLGKDHRAVAIVWEVVRLLNDKIDPEGAVARSAPEEGQVVRASPEAVMRPQTALTPAAPPAPKPVEAPGRGEGSRARRPPSFWKVLAVALVPWLLLALYVYFYIVRG
jgi:hypothetical protein